MPKLDLKRLAKDVDTLRTSRPLGIGPGGRRLTGAMAMVRDNLEALEALHAAGASWVDLAAGLAAQGVTQGQGDPLTGKRLTALIASVKRQAARHAAAAARRKTRPDLRALTVSTARREPPPESTPSPAASRLAPELRDRPAPPPGDDAPLSEAEIRRIQAERHSHLFKKD
ncbi:hypothetical protein [Methylobacterium fujisawaense]|uniref:hypothetical protein n=1 Tax=Methylobacterium fujisawaense TaxID=107400 RepID=UPI00313DA6EE